MTILNAQIESDSLPSLPLQNNAAVILVSPILPRPYIDSCESKSDAHSCAQKVLMEFIYSNIQFPSEEDCEGTVVICYEVDTSGQVLNEAIKRDFCSWYGKESLRVFKVMKSRFKCWIPGKKNGDTANMKMCMPIRFKMKE